MSMLLPSLIWHVCGTLPLRTGRTSPDVFDKLKSAIDDKGTTFERTEDTFKFSKNSPSSQDKFAIFDSGIFHITASSTSRMELNYDLTSRILLYCFCAPLLFLVLAALFESARISGCVFAGIFVVLYVAGRFIEDKQARTLLSTALRSSTGDAC